MSNNEIIRAWKDEDYFNNLSQEKRSQLPENPAGIVELSDAEMEILAGGAKFTNLGGSGSCNVSKSGDCETLKKKGKIGTIIRLANGDKIFIPCQNSNFPNQS